MASFQDTPTRSRDDQSMELPTLPSMYPHDSEGDSMLSELSRSLHQQGNLSISQILSSTPGSYPGSTAATPAAATPAAAQPPAATTPQPDTPLSSTSFHSPQLSLASISTPLSSTPHASYAASQSRLSVLRSGGSGTYSTPRSDPDSTTSSRTRFALSGPWNQADDSHEGGESFNTPAIHSRFSGGPNSFDFAPDDDDDDEREAEQDSFAPRQQAPSPAGNVEDAANDDSFSSLPEAPEDGFRDVDLTSRSEAEAASRTAADVSGAGSEGANESGDEPYVEMPSLERSFEMPVNFGTPGPASMSRLTSQELSLVQEEEEEEEDEVAVAQNVDPADDDSLGEESVNDSAGEGSLAEQSSPEMKSMFINLSRRRSNSRNYRGTLPLLHSPASTSSMSNSSAATPNGMSQASARRDSFQVKDQSLESDEEPAPHEVADLTTDSLVAPQTFRDFSIPIPESNYGTPSPSSSGPPRGPLSTPKPSAALELRKNVALAALASASRPKMRGTPHTRRSSSFVGTQQHSIDLSQQHQSPSRGQSFNESLISLGQLTVDDGNTSVLSVESAEDLTNLHRANTSLPLSEATPKQGGIKIHKHLHNLNTQLHLRNTTLQDERDQLEAENDNLRRRLEQLEREAEGSNTPMSALPADEVRAAELQHALEESEEELYALRQMVEADAAKRAEQEEELQRLQGLDEELRVLRDQVDLISQRHESNVLPTAGDRAANTGAEGHDESVIHHAEVVRLQAEVEERAQIARVSEAALVALQTEFDRQTKAHAHKLQQLESDIEVILKTNQAEVEHAVREKEHAVAQLADQVDQAAAAKKALEDEQAEALASLDLAKARITALEAEARATHQTISQQEALVERLSQSVNDDERADRIKSLEVELSSVKLEAEHRASDLLRQLDERSASLAEARTTLVQTKDALAEADAERLRLRDESGKRADELLVAQTKLAAQADLLEDYKANGGELTEEVEELRSQLLDLGDKLAASVLLQESQSDKQAQLEDAHADALAKAQTVYGDRIRLLEDQLHDARGQAAQDSHALAALREQIDCSPSPNQTPKAQSRSPVSFGTPAGNVNPIVEDLHEQLHTAHVEIGRLQAELAASPYKRAAIEARDLRIQVLESHQSNIDSQFSVLRRQSRKLSVGSHASFNTSIANQTIMSVRTPKSVGPLRKMPWLEQTPGAPSDSPLLAEVARLRQQLDDLNELVDDGVDRLKNAGADQATLSRQVSDAKDEIVALQDQLAKLRHNERSTALEQARSERAKVSLQADVQDLTQDLDKARRELSQVKRDNSSLQEDVRAATRDYESCKRDLQDAEEHVDRLQQSLDRARAQTDGGTREDARELETLRQARTQLEAQMARAQQDLKDVQRALSAELDTARTTNGTLRSELTSQALQIDQLRRAQAEGARDSVGREGTLREIADLQQDLLHTRRDVKSLEEEIRVSRKREEAAQRTASRHDEEENRQVRGALQDAYADLDAQKVKHRKEAQGIFTEVRHLKAVISRETTFRADLALQKEYLLILIGQLSRQQARVYAAIAQLGYPHAPVAPKRRSFKSVALAVLMTVRASKLAGRWSRELETKRALKAAYERVRAGRLLLQPVPDVQKASAREGVPRPASRTSSSKAVDSDMPARKRPSTTSAVVR